MEHEKDDIVMKYLEMMDLQREPLFAMLDGLSERSLWQRPTKDE